MKQLAINSKKTAKELMKLSNSDRKEVLIKLADDLLANKELIISENKKDIEFAKESNLSSAMIDRLTLDEKRIEQMVSGVKQIAEQKDVIGSFYDEFTDGKGLNVKKQRIPLGVILMIFESRPNVVVDCAALAIKSSNAIILKGGKEAKYSNEFLGSIINNSIQNKIPKETVQVLASDDRSVINELLSFKDEIDVVIPRGGHKLIEYVADNAKMPVIAHYQGLCHMYLDKDADIDMAIELAINAKTQRTGVCNAIETLLVHEDLLPKIASKLTSAFLEKDTELRVDDKFMLASKAELKRASNIDWETEYLDNILSIRTVNSVDEAIDHISDFGSHHSECIVSKNSETCEKFLNQVDASCIMINASTRFNDGGQLGLGAELGISTTKIHAYGPMGAEQMTTSRYVVSGNGHIRQ